MQNKRNRHGREGHNVTGEPQDSIHLGLGERIRLEDIPIENESGDRQVGNRLYNDGRYLLKNKNSNWRLISAQILIDSLTAGRINASWYSTANLLRTLTNSSLVFAGATSVGNLRWDLVELYDNGTAAVKTGVQGAVPIRPTPTTNTLIAGEFIWDENGNAIPAETIGSFSNDRYSTLVAPNTTGKYAKIWEGDLSYVNNYGIFISYHEPTNPVNEVGTGTGVLKVSWTCDTSKNIDPDTVKMFTFRGSVNGEFRLVQLAGNKAAIYHRSNHYWGRIQFRIVFQNSSVRIEDFVNLGPYLTPAPTGVGFWDSSVESGDINGTINRLAKFIAENIIGDSQIIDLGTAILINRPANESSGDRLQVGGSMYLVSGDYKVQNLRGLWADESNKIRINADFGWEIFSWKDTLIKSNLEVENQISTPMVIKGNSGAGTITFNWDNGNIQSVTLTGNCTFAFSNPKSGASYQLLITQDGTGGRTVTWPSGVFWEGKSLPALTATAGGLDVVTMVYDGTKYVGLIAKNFGTA